MTLGLYGKHPGWGDFVQAGLPVPLLAPLEAWLDAVLTEARAALGPDWEPVWDRDGTARPVLRFWLGEELWGQPVCGVMAASCDRVGRRFPLLMLAAGLPVPPPVLDPVQDWYDAAEAHLRGRLAATSAGGAPAALLDGLDLPRVPEEVAGPGPSGFWAMGVPQDLAALMADIAATDHRRASGGRSYWWRAGHAGAADEGEGMPEDAVPVPEGAEDTVLVEEGQGEEGQGEAGLGEAGSDPAGVAEDAVVPLAQLLAEAEDDALAPPQAPLVSAEAEDAPGAAVGALWQVGPRAAAALPAIALPASNDHAGAGVLADAWASDAWAADAWLDPAVPEDPLDLAVPGDPVPVPAAPPPRPRAEPVRASQVYAGPGLPDGAVLAWLLRGEATG